MAFAIDRVGTWTAEIEIVVDAARTIAYAEATNDPLPAHRGGDLAPPVFAVVPAWEPMTAAVTMVTPPEAMLGVLHAEQDLWLHRPIVPGMVLRTRAAPVGVAVRRSGTSVVTKVESRDAADGALVNEQFSVAFFRGAADGAGAGADAPSHRLPATVRAGEPVAAVTQRLDADQTFRYSAASGDLVPIHLDDEVARSVGLPGIIVHGLCTMAFTSWAAIERLAGGDPTRLRRLAVRFSRPVLPGQSIATRFFDAGAEGGRRRYAFETAGPDGDTVVKDGLAEVAEVAG